MPPRHPARRPQPRTNDCERIADPGSAIPVEDRVCGLGHGVVGPATLQRPRDPGQPGAEAEHLHSGEGASRRVGELQQVARVVGHRTGDVEDEDQRSHPQAPASPVELDRARRASASSRAPSGARPAVGPSGRALEAAGPPARWCQPDPGHDAPQGRQLLWRAGGERLVAEHLHVRGHQAEPGLALVVTIPRPLRVGDLQDRLRLCRRRSDRRLQRRLAARRPPRGRSDGTRGRRSGSGRGR